MTPLDATSSLFLGYRHGRGSLPAWTSLTTGVPAALAELGAARRVGAAVAAAQGADGGLVARSTLHALIDIMSEVPRAGDVVALDSATYPIAQWAALLAAARGASVCTYPHHRPDLLCVPADRRMVVVTDGWCPGCNRPAPLARLQRMARRHRGVLVVDDSLAFGVLGARAPDAHFGDGSGTVRWAGVRHRDVVWVASLAKAYGAPLSVITGDRSAVHALDRHGRSRIHSSPPSAADLAAASNALHDPTAPARRARLLDHVLKLRRRLSAAGLVASGSPFPVVGVRLSSPGEAWRWWSALRGRGIVTVVQRPRCRGGAQLAVLLRADHAGRDVERLAGELARLAERGVAA